jgi:dUTP pyrophosphatase
MDRSIYFEKVSKYADDADVALPIRKTQYSAGYDLAAAEDYIIPSLW